MTRRGKLAGIHLGALAGVSCLRQLARSIYIYTSTLATLSRSESSLFPPCILLLLPSLLYARLSFCLSVHASPSRLLHSTLPPSSGRTHLKHGLHPFTCITLARLKTIQCQCALSDIKSRLPKACDSEWISISGAATFPHPPAPSPPPSTTCPSGNGASHRPLAGSRERR